MGFYETVKIVEPVVLRASTSRWCLLPDAFYVWIILNLIIHCYHGASEFHGCGNDNSVCGVAVDGLRKVHRSDGNGVVDRNEVDKRESLG